MMPRLREPGDQHDVATLERTFGRVVFVHLRRADIVGQAVSWCRAEQTGVWQQGDVALRSPEPDLDRMKQLVATIREHHEGWRSWFDRHGVQPRHVTYERLVRDPRAVVHDIASHLGVQLPARWRPDPPDRRQADGTSALWAAALNEALDV